LHRYDLPSPSVSCARRISLTPRALPGDGGGTERAEVEPARAPAEAERPLRNGTKTSGASGTPARGGRALVFDEEEADGARATRGLGGLVLPLAALVGLLVGALAAGETDRAIAAGVVV